MFKSEDVMKKLQILFFLFGSIFLINSLAIGGTTFEVKVTANNDDAEERADGSMYRDSSDLELTKDGGYQKVGMRFVGITVPQGATITNAYIEFTVDETDAEDGTLTITGEDIDDADGFSSNDNDITDRTPTFASVEWVLSDENRWDSVGSKKQTPDIRTIIQEIVSRGGWVTGNDLVIIIEGQAERVAESKDGSTSKAPKLHIEYEVGPAAPTIALNPSSSLGASSYVGTNATSNSFEITNVGSADLNFTLTDDATWLSCSSNCSGIVAPGDSVTVGVSYNNYTLGTGTYSGRFTITDTNATNSPLEYDVILLVQEIATGSTCGDVPIYAQNLVNPAILVLLDVSSSMNAQMPVTSTDDNPTTPDLKDIVQEIIEIPAWDGSTQSMSFIITGTGERVAESYDGVSSAAPLLKVEYTLPADPTTTLTLETRVTQSNDDAEESSSGSVNLTSSDLEMVFDGSNQKIGIRFQNITIPSNATITSASIEFTVDEPDPTATTNLTITGDDTINSPVFSTTNKISTRIPTTASIPWSNLPAWTEPPSKARYVIGREVISELVEDTSISWAYGTWAFSSYSGPGSGPDTSLLPANPYGASQTALFTKIHEGVKSRNAAETVTLKATIEATATTSGTPFGPSLLATREYYAGNKADENGGIYDSTLTCQPKFLIDVTDGLGYSPHTSTTIINQYSNLLADEKISSVAVGFGLDDATQVSEMAKVANARGTEDGLYALHEVDAVTGDGLPFIAQNQEELTTALQTVTNSIKQQIFIGSSPAPSTSVDSGTFVINASFNAADWTGDLSATPYDPESGAIMMCVDSIGNQTCNQADVVGKCLDVGDPSCDVADIEIGDCLCWTASDGVPTTKNAWTVDGTVSTAGTLLLPGIAGQYVDDHTALGSYEVALDGDNYICKDIGDIIKSTPVITEAPNRPFSFDNYRFFKFSSVKDRDDMLYVGVNDGAIHAHNLKTGVEEWRFYPEALHQKLIDTDICSSGYCHEYFVDGTPVVTDIYRGTAFDNYTGPTLTQTGWRSVLTAGLGSGGDAYFALDVTSANSFIENGSDPLTSTMYLWQFSDDQLGMTQGVPVTGRIDSAAVALPQATFGGWVTLFGSGYDTGGSTFKESYLYGIDAYTSDSVWLDTASSTYFNRLKMEEDDRINYIDQFGTEFAAAQTVTGKDSGATAVISSVSDTTSTGILILSSITGTFTDGEILQVTGVDIATLSGPIHSAFFNDALSDPFVADLDFDNFADFLYIGNMYGRMYRVSSFGKDEDPVKGVLFDIDSTTATHNTPIRAGASVGYDSGPETIWVYFGTGRFESQADKFNTEQQYFVGVKDYKSSPVSNSTLTDLLERQTEAVTATFNSETKEYRVMTGHSYYYTGSSTLTVGSTMNGNSSGAIGIIESLSTLNGKKIVKFEEADFLTGGNFVMEEEIYDDSDSAIRATLHNHPWFSKLQQTAGIPSERVVARSLVVGGVVFFTSFIPDEDVCGGNGAAWLYALDYETGLPPSDAVFDINGDGVFDDNDTITHDGKKYPVAAISIGRGIPSAPVLEGDMIFVNTTDAARPGLPVNLPKLKATISAWKDGGF